MCVNTDTEKLAQELGSWHSSPEPWRYNKISLAFLLSEPPCSQSCHHTRCQALGWTIIDIILCHASCPLAGVLSHHPDSTDKNTTAQSCQAAPQSEAETWLSEKFPAPIRSPQGHTAPHHGWVWYKNNTCHLPSSVCQSLSQNIFMSQLWVLWVSCPTVSPALPDV